MIALLQRVTQASVTIRGARVAEIGPGLLVLVGVRRADDEPQVRRLAERILGYRVFADAGGRMNRNVVDAGGEVLLVPQFTLAADTASGTRAGFSTAAEPERAGKLFDRLVQHVRATLPDTPTGQFGADMRVALVNDGPVTFWLEAR